MLKKSGFYRISTVLQLHKSTNKSHDTFFSNLTTNPRSDNNPHLINHTSTIM